MGMHIPLATGCVVYTGTNVKLWERWGTICGMYPHIVPGNK